MTTLPKLMVEHAQKRPRDVAMREKRHGIWQPTTWAQLEDLVKDLACGLHEGGVRRGEFVAVVGGSRPRLYAAMLAVQSLGAIPAPLHHDVAAEELTNQLNGACIRFAIVEDQEQVDGILDVRGAYSNLRHIVYDNPRGLRNYRDASLSSLDALIERGAAFAALHPGFIDRELLQGADAEEAALFFTSGTTGHPKGVVHTHGSMTDQARATAELDRLGSKEQVFAYESPAWLANTIVCFSQWLVCGYTINFPESSHTTLIDLKEVGPTYFLGSPRFFESLLTSVSVRMESAGWLQRGLFDQATKSARRSGRLPQRNGALQRALSFIGNLVVYAPMRNNLGLRRVRVAYVAGDAIGADLFNFYRAIGVNLKQLYGTTEMAAWVCMQTDSEVRADTVGSAIDGVEIKLSADNEVLVKSPGLLHYYHGDRKRTLDAFQPDGFYRTRDAGTVDSRGRLTIVDRIDDLGRFKSGPNAGALFTPKYVESKLRFYPYIKQAVAFGNARDRVSVMMNIDFDAVGSWAEKRNVAYTGYADLAQKPEVYTLIRDSIERINADLATDDQHACLQICRFVILHKELDADDGELTRNGSLRRGFINSKYESLVDALYGNVTHKLVETEVRFDDGRVGKLTAMLRIADARTLPATRAAA